MAHAAPAQITCRVCDGWYPSESELRAHMQAAHRRFIPEPIAFPNGDTQQASPKPEPRTPNEKWTNEDSSPVSVQSSARNSR
jgi:hypothetical protein